LGLDILKTNQVQIGRVGEYIAAAIITELGWHATFVANAPYDLIATRQDQLLRVQVKTTESAKLHSGSLSYQWSLGAGFEKRGVDPKEYEILCCVGLDARRAFFVSALQVEGKKTLRRSAARVIVCAAEAKSWCAVVNEKHL
jgi:hypothetical protein